MKRIILLVMLAAFLVTGSGSFAKEDFMINCCLGGKCEKMTKAACKDFKGTVVKDCRECK